MKDRYYIIIDIIKLSSSWLSSSSNSQYQN